MKSKFPCRVLTLPSVKFYLDESIFALRVMWNHLDSNICTDDSIQRELIPPVIAVVIVTKSLTSQQLQLQYRTDT